MSASNSASKWNFFATASWGLESSLAQELEALGATGIEKQSAGVHFGGGLEVAYRVLLQSRIASRVFYPLSEFEAHTPDHLYAGIKKIPWLDHFSSEQTFAIKFVTNELGDAGIRHTIFGVQKSKDAIVDYFKEKKRERPNVDPENPNIKIQVALRNRKVKVGLDLSGSSLHERGYRLEAYDAPLKETLAAGLLGLAGWPKPETPLLDPMCGSGTFLIEALIAKFNLPIQYGRLKAIDRGFTVTHWKKHNDKLWQRALDELQDLKTKAKHQAEKDRQEKRIWVYGSDGSSGAIRVFQKNLRRASNLYELDLEPFAKFEVKEWSQVKKPVEQGTLIVNPPYGERLGEVDALRLTYQELGDGFKKEFPGWTCFVLTGNEELSKLIGLRAAKKYRVKNGPLESLFLEFPIRSGKYESL